jgi:hypothetical protein
MQSAIKLSFGGFFLSKILKQNNEGMPQGSGCPLYLFISRKKEKKRMPFPSLMQIRFSEEIHIK